MAKRERTELPELSSQDCISKIEGASVQLLDGCIPNKKVIKNVVKSLFSIVESNYKVVGVLTWQDKRNVMNIVFSRINY